MERSSGSNNIPSESSGQIDSMVIYMDRNLFDAAVFGHMEPLDPHINHLDRLVDGNQNTALHIYLAKGELLNRDHVQQLLEKCPSLLRQKNDRDEIPLHIAAKLWQDDIVELLIERSKEQDGGDLEHMLRMKDKDDNTALHTALHTAALQKYYRPVNVAQMLLNEDPDLIYSVNKNRETPLYLAAFLIGSGWDDWVADHILDADHCKPTAVGPHGRTILHAAILAKNKGMIEKILDRKKQLARERDEDGRTPLHYAAYIGSLSAAEMLLKYDAGAACLTDKRRMSPLHMASWQGKNDVMKAIISSCPGCIEIVDNKGWNFLHYAFITRPHSYEEYLLDILFFMEKMPNWISTTMFDLITYNDKKDGITVMDVFRYCTSLHPTDDRYWRFRRFLEQAQQPFGDNGLPLPQEKIKKIGAVLKEINNAQVAGLPPADHDLRNMEVIKDIHNTKMREVRETYLLVVTLVATVTFAAGLNLPGGYDDKEGTAILKNLAFKAFVIADVLAFVSSLSAVLTRLYIVFFRSEQYLSKLIRQGDVLTLFATVMMVIAFSTGLYATLSESSPWLAIASCCIANAVFLIVAFFYIVIKNKRPHDEKLAQLSDEMKRIIQNEMERSRRSPKMKEPIKLYQVSLTI